MESATAVINEAKARKIIDAPMPVDEGERIERATSLVEKAQAAVEKATGDRKDAVVAILNAAGANVGAPASTEPQPSETSGQEDSPQGESLGSTKRGRPLSEAFRFSYDMAGQSHSEDIAVPAEVEGELPVLPIDMTQLSDLELRRLYSKFTAMSVRTAWLVSIEKGKATSAKALERDAFDKALRAVDKTEPGSEKAKLAAVVEAEANEDPEVKQWRATAGRHSDNLEKLKALRETHTESCDRISREWTMRTEEFQKAGGLRSR